MTGHRTSSAISAETEIHIRRRVIPGLLIAGVFALCLALGGLVWAAFMYTMFWLMLIEMLKMLRVKNIQPSRFTTMVIGSGFYVAAYLGYEQHNTVLVTLGAIVAFVLMLFRPLRGSISDIGASILTLVYVGFLPAHFIMLRQLNGTMGDAPFYSQPGFHFVMLVACTIIANDIGAYYAGKQLGKNQLSPHISPSKTIEGSIGGVICGVIVAVALASVWGLSWIHGLVLGIIMSLVAQLGDLSESLLKRDAGVKDSGELLLGHGGVLDRVDGYIFSGAVAYYYIVWFVLHQGLAKDIMELMGGG